MTAIATVSLLAGLFVFAGNALAVHDEGMQLDGDLSALCPPGSPPPLPLCSESLQKDWSNLFIVTNTPTPAPGTEAVTNNTAIIGAAGSPFTHGTFIRDFESGTTTANCAIDSLATTKFCTGDDTTFATGSKDTLDINPNPGGWQCNHDNNVNSKIDIMNAYAVAYTIPGTPAPGSDAGDKIMYFGLEKNKDNGVNDVGFWFLQGNSNCSAPTGAEDFTGTHTPGDVLVVSEYTRGGGVSNITAYRWVGGSNPLAQIGTAGDCKGSSGGDTMCATTNSGAILFNTTAATPWLTSDATLGVGRNQIVPPDFFEGGINLTKAFAGTGTPPPSCFNTFIADTRSSKETGATLFDYARGQLGQCTASLTTQQNAVVAPATSISIGTGTVSSGTDTATLTITGTPTWGGQLTWYLCGPVATDVCDNTGVQVTSRTVSQASPPADFVSGTATLSSVGRYCWTAHFEPNQATKDAGINPLDDTAVNECFTVAPVTPTLVTQASCSATPCVVGSTLSDTATLSLAATGPGTGGANSKYPTINATTFPPAGGTISFAAFGPNNCTTVALASTTRAVSGNGTYPTASQTAVSFVAGATGLYTFVASYSGDSPNTNASTPLSCANQPTNEQVTVIGTVSSASAQRWLPNDRVVLTSTPNTTLNGNLTVTLYKGVFGGTASSCTVGTGVAVSGQSYTTPVATATNTFAFNTTNTTFVVGTNSDGTTTGAGTDGTYFWLIHYVDNSLTSPTDRCETTTISHNDG